MQLSRFLNFEGNCERAVRFYENAGLGRVIDLRRFEGSPRTCVRTSSIKSCNPISKGLGSVSTRPTRCGSDVERRILNLNY
jgi:hypothetical protein